MQVVGSLNVAVNLFIEQPIIKRAFLLLPNGKQANPEYFFMLFSSDGQC